MTFNPGTVAKALMAALVAGGGAYTVALQDGTLTNVELVNVIVVTLVAALAVYSTPNDEKVVPEEPTGVHATDATP